MRTPPDLPPAERHDPAQAPLPPYYPDTPTARRTLARVQDCITAMDQHAGRILAELEQAGLQDDTLVFFWPDHGQGIPRGKRTLWDTGLKIPLVISFPDKYRHLAPAAPGGTCDRLVSLMDFGPTLLSLLELPIPPHMQGRAFLGPAAAAPRPYLFGARDRVDEVLELSRSVRDQRYLYLHNFMPDLSWNQPEAFSDQLELRREITRLAAAGKLDAAQLAYAGPAKPVEALYDTQTDPWQVHNLADDPAHRPVLERMRTALREWQIESRDLGLMHEWQAAQLCATAGRPLFELASAEDRFPLQRVLDTAWRVGQAGEAQEFARRLADPDPTVRYWAVDRPARGRRRSGRGPGRAAQGPGRRIAAGPHRSGRRPGRAAPPTGPRSSGSPASWPATTNTPCCTPRGRCKCWARRAAPRCRPCRRPCRGSRTCSPAGPSPARSTRLSGIDEPVVQPQTPAAPRKKPRTPPP